MQTKKQSYKSTCSYYDEVRLAALDQSLDQLPQILIGKNGAINKRDISLSVIDFSIIQKLKDWEHSGRRVVTWDWEAVRKKYRTHPKRFEVSIWHKNNFLSGASIGRPTRNGSKLRLDFIEANPSHSPLSGLVTDIVVSCGRFYAEAIGATQLRIMNPVNERVRNHYLSKDGFLYNRDGNFCYSDI